MNDPKKTKEELFREVEKLREELAGAKRPGAGSAAGENTLQEGERKFRELFDHMRSGVAIYEPSRGGKDFIFKNLNKAGERIDKVNREDIIGKCVTEVFPNVKEFGLFEVFQRVWKTAKPEYFPATLYKDERNSGWRENYVYKLPSGEIVAIYDDVTARKRAEEALEESEAHYRKMAANVPGLVYQFFMGPDGFISFSFVSDSCREIFDLDPGEIQLDANRFLDTMHPDDRENFYQVLKKAAESLAPCAWEGRIVVSGEEKWFQAISRPQRQTGGEIMWDGLLIDITERKKMEESQRLAHLGELLSDMAHEVNTPIQIILARSQLCMMADPDNKVVRDNLEIIKDQCDRARDIVQRLLMYAKPSKGKVEKIDLNKSLEFIADLIGHHFLVNNVKISKDLTEAPLVAKINEKQMQQVFINLLWNAADAMPKGGMITISSFKEKDGVRIEFKDTGCGISAENIKRIFDPFFTTKEKGTGLGLSVCFGIMKAHGGTLRHTSVPGEGTTATIFLSTTNTNHSK